MNQHERFELRSDIARLGGATLLACAALLALVDSAAATTGGRQAFAWAEQENIPIGQSYIPNANFTAPVAAGDPPNLAVVRTGIGEYRVQVGNHEPFFPYQSQVVAYGSDNKRCKFSTRSTPVNCTLIGGGTGWCSLFSVSCFTAAGAAANSKFVFSFSGRAINAVPQLLGPAAFLETANGGTAIARNWRERAGGRFDEGPAPMSGNSSAGNPEPTLRRNNVGSYTVEFPGLGTPNPGIVQLTAVGPGTAHCVTSILPWTSGTKIVVQIGCWAGASRADSDFILNYDQVVTRISTGHQGARGVGDRLVASFTPNRSFNSGAQYDVPATNTAFRTGAGLYRMRHGHVGKTPSSAWVGAYNGNGGYCKLEAWFFTSSIGTDVFMRCFNAQGVLADSGYIETFQANVIAPQ